MRLNRKGYMLVEIIIATVLAASITYFLLNLTYKFKNTNEDIFQAYTYTKVKMLITKNIMADLEKGIVYPMDFVDTNTEKTILFTYRLKEDESIEEGRMLKINIGSTIVIKYGKIDVIEGNYTFDTNHISYYEKELPSSLIVKDLELKPIISERDSLYNMSIKIPIESIYDDNDYSIKLFLYINELKPH